MWQSVPLKDPIFCNQRVNVLGKFDGDARILSTVQSGESIHVEVVADHGGA